MLVDSLHNEIILYSAFGSTICNVPYKGIFAFNGSSFRALNKGVNTHNPNPMTGGESIVNDCIRYGNSTLFGGFFRSVSSTTLLAKSLALWNGAVWDTFPNHVFPNNLTYSGGGFWGFLKHDAKLWMYGAFDTIGNLVTKNLVSFDGNNFAAVPSPPISNYQSINKMIVYKDKLIIAGTFYDYPSWDYYRLAQFDGSSWSQVGNGVRGGLSGVWDMRIYNDTLYIAGSYPKTAGNIGNYIMKWDGTQLHDAGFGDFCGYGAISSLLPYKNRLYAFGNFSCAADKKAFGVAYYENGAWTVPQDSVENLGIRSAVVYNGDIYISGAFKSINGDTSIAKFARLLCPDFDAAGGCISGLKETKDDPHFNLFPNPTNGKFYFEYNTAFKIHKLTLTSTLGEEIYSITKPQPQQEIDVQNLAAGVYYLKVLSQAAQKVFKVVKE